MRVRVSVRIFALAASLAIVAAALPASPALGQGSMPDKTLAFRSAMRRLWEDHITWTRLYIVSVAGNLPDKDATAQRLLRNQADIGGAIKGYYGNEAGDKLTALLRTHILTAADLLAGAKTGNTAKINAASKRWYANADEIATFLSTANPNAWPLAEMKSMMRGHLDLTLQEATARLKRDWAADIAAYDKVHDQILEMADMLSAGIIQQFPDKFK